MRKEIILAGGCFWGLEDLLRKGKGVIETEVGYIGGKNNDPTYENHPGHAEAVRVVYDDSETNLQEVLDLFFRIHNPTTLNQQGNDRGDSYRSAIFYANQQEKEESEQFIERVNASGRWNDQVVTTLEPRTTFTRAESYHQNYLVKNRNGYTCHRIYTDSYIEKNT